MGYYYCGGGIGFMKREAVSKLLRVIRDLP